jgi:outer membrane protein assembly factor BamE
MYEPQPSIGYYALRLSPSCRQRTNNLNRHMQNLSYLLQRLLLLAFITIAIQSCVYRVDVQQGNLLEDNDVEAVQIGMTRSQVRFLLGTPVVEDSFHHDRWDYIYYFRQGRRRNADRSWLIVYFDGDRVKEIDYDVPIELS